MPVERRKLTSFSPDIDPITKDVVLDTNGVYPTTRGYKAYPGLLPYTAALPSACLGAFIGQPGGGAVVIVAGTSTQLYKLVNGAWASQALTVTPMILGERWRFAMYGLDIIAVNGIDPPFVSSSGGAFAPLGGSPPVSDCVAATDFSVFLTEKDSFTWISTLSDLIWTPGIPTETVTADLNSTPGQIIGAWALRGGIALYKEKAIHAATFQGPPFYWQFQKISPTIGPPSNEGVVSTGDFHYFPGPDGNFYRFDGFNLVPIPNRLRSFFVNDWNQAYKSLTWGSWDEPRSLVTWYYVSRSASPTNAVDSYICLNTQTGEWAAGRNLVRYDGNSYPVEAVANGTIPAINGLTYAQFEALFGTYAAIPDIPYNWPGFSVSGTDLAAIFLPDHKMYVYLGSAPTQPGAYVTSGDFGDRRNIWETRRIRPGYSEYPPNAQCEILAQYLQGTTPTLVQTVPLSPDGYFNVHYTNRLQRFRFRNFGDAELVDFEVEFEPAGEL